MWEKELEIIESLGKLYPIIYDDTVEYKDYQQNNYDKAWWVHLLCRYHLNRRLPRLEEFVKENNKWLWDWYEEYFNIMGE